VIETILRVLLINFVVVMACMTLLWLVALKLKDVSIVDCFWGPGFAVVAVTTALLVTPAGVQAKIIGALTFLWAMRLGAYLTWRKWGEGEDPRYSAFMDKVPANKKAWFAFQRIFGMQGVILWVISIPVQLGMILPMPPAIGPFMIFGILLWIVGFAFETIGDWQMMQFKADPANHGKIMDRGLWRYTRHPNYFGDAAVWFGLWFMACENPWNVFTVFAPIWMTYLLLKVTGAALLERRLKRAKPEYEAYVKRTSGFVPWWPKKVKPAKPAAATGPAD